MHSSFRARLAAVHAERGAISDELAAASELTTAPGGAAELPLMADELAISLEENTRAESAMQSAHSHSVIALSTPVQWARVRGSVGGRAGRGAPTGGRAPPLQCGHCGSRGSHLANGVSSHPPPRAQQVCVAYPYPRAAGPVGGEMCALHTCLTLRACLAMGLLLAQRTGLGTNPAPAPTLPSLPHRRAVSGPKYFAVLSHMLKFEPAAFAERAE
jgi:hypothetical protein